jgi:hypothetical protein
MPDDPDDTKPAPAINWVQVTAGALAAVTSAVLLSTIGVAGTLLGAALGSVAASVGNAVYSRTIQASHRRVAAQAEALRSVSKARDRLGTVDDGGTGDTLVDAQLEDAGHELDHAEQALQESATTDASTAAADAAADAAWGDGDGDDTTTSPWRNLPWKRIGVLAAGLFLVVMLAITVFELVAGRSVSEITGGTTDGRSTTVPGIDRDTSATPTPSPTPTDGPSESVSPTAEPTPTDEATPTEEPSQTPEPTATDSVSPTAEPTPTGADATGDAGQRVTGGDPTPVGGGPSGR